MPTSVKLIRFLVTLSVTLINLFFKIARTKVNRVVKRISVHEDKSEEILSHVKYNGGKLSSRSEDKRPIYASRRPREYERQSSSRYELRQHGARSNLPPIGTYVKYYHAFTHLYNWYLLIKNSILCFLRQETLAKHRYLDCFVPGRLIMNGRAIEVVPACACYASAMRLIWHFTMMRRTPEFRMPCIEFLLDHKGHESYWLNRPSRNVKRTHHSQLLEYQNPFEQASHGSGLEARQPTATAAAHTHKLRPNRTRDAWDALAKVTTTHHAIFFAFFTFLVLFFYGMGLPITLTQRGFEYNYRYCIQWAVDHRAAVRQRHLTDNKTSLASTIAGHIYDAFLEASGYGQPAVGTNRPTTAGKFRPIREFFSPYTNFVPLSTFHLIRMSHELLDSFILYWELAFFYNSACFMSFIMSKDITYYCQSINRRLEQLILLLRSASLTSAKGVQDQIDNLARNHHYDSIYYESGRTGRSLKGSKYARAGGARSTWEISRSEIAKPTALYNIQPALRSEVSDIQAQIADLFTLIDTYNKYISLQSMCLIVCWLGYSALVSSWIFLPGNDNPKMEWYVAHVGATFYVFIMLSSMSNVKTSCRRLYRLIAVAMALDEDYETGKMIWVSLLKFYSPRPLYCFTLIGSIEITYMLGLKLLVWLVSALIVASSFFQVYNIK